MIEYNKKSARAWSLLGTCGAHGIAARELVESNPKVVIMTADLCSFSGLDRLKTSCPDRIYNVGIAEQNMIGIAAGLAKEGFVPFVNTYASFCTSRCADQVRVNMSYMKFPIKLIGLTAGYAVGILGATHISIEDMALMRALPNITLISPADCMETVKAMIAVSDTPDPTYIRLTGSVNTPIVYTEDYEFRIGKAIWLCRGTDVCLIATGSMVSVALEAVRMLQEDGISSSVINMHTVKPLDKDALMEANEAHRLIVTVEEHSIIGGLYGAVSEILCRLGSHKTVVPIGIEDLFVHAGSYSWQLQESGLTSANIRVKVQNFFNK